MKMDKPEHGLDTPDDNYTMTIYKFATKLVCVLQFILRVLQA